MTMTAYRGPSVGSVEAMEERQLVVVSISLKY